MSTKTSELLYAELVTCIAVLKITQHTLHKAQLKNLSSPEDLRALQKQLDEFLKGREEHMALIQQVIQADTRLSFLDVMSICVALALFFVAAASLLQ